MQWLRFLLLCSAALALVFLAGCQGLVPGSSQYQLTVTPSAAGAGTVTSSPSGISCPGTCMASFASGTQVTLTATPSSGYFFNGWQGGNCAGTSTCTVTMTTATNVNALFATGNQLTVQLTGAGTGTVTSSPAGINCPTTCGAAFPPNTQITLSETPGATFTFAGWSGACTSTATTCSVTLSSGTASVMAAFGGSLESVNHIVVFLQENRSFDSYFGALRAYWAQNGFPDQSFDGLPQFNPSSGIAPLEGPAPSVPGCDPAKPFPTYIYCNADPQNPITSYHSASICQEELSPFWNESHNDYSYGDSEGNGPALMNGFVISGADDARQYNNPGPSNDVNGLRTMGYFDWTDLNYYYFMASNFATSDRWFSPVMDRTQINRMYLLAATSAGHVYPLHNQPQLTATTIFEELQNAGISWKIYEDPTGTPCASNPTGPCLESISYINQFAYGDQIARSPTLSQNIVPISQYTTDLQNGTLPQVALIEPASAAGLDEHPTDVNSQGGVNIQAGANFAAGLINGLMTSSSWKDSILIFSYDEFGGFYDHVPPQPMPSPDGIPPTGLQPGDACDSTTGPLCNFTWTGYRVPLIVISPFSKKNFVSHTVRDYTAILKLIETRFGLPPLTQRDAAQADMSEFFDFVNVPWATPPSPPAQVRNGTCSLAAPNP
jgi:phospholipase C